MTNTAVGQHVARNESQAAAAGQGMFHPDNPDSTRGSGGMSEDLRASMQRTSGGAFDGDTQRVVPPQLSSPVPTGLSAPDQKFGAGFWMPQVDDDPLYLGPLKSSFVFPLPSSVDEAVQLAWTASYRCACPRACKRPAWPSQPAHGVHQIT